MFSEKTTPTTVDSPRIDIMPQQALMDAEVQIRLLNCVPNQRLPWRTIK